MNTPPEFAEQYSAKERARFVLGGVAAGLLVMLCGRLWLFPWLHAFAATAACRSIIGINGIVLLLYGLFVGLPLACAVVVGATLGRRGLRILSDGQVPPRREKVFRPTRIQRGSRARISGVVHAAAFVPFVALALWGWFQAAGLSTARVTPDSARACAGHHLVAANGLQSSDGLPARHQVLEKVAR